MPVPIITDKYIIIRVASPDDFDPDSFRTLWVDKDKGIQEIMGQHLKTNQNEVQAYVFDKNSYTIEEARNWVKNKYSNNESTAGEIHAKKRAYVVANMVLCTSKPNLTVGNVDATKLTPEIFAKTQAQAALNDRYYFYVEGVHEGANGNGDYFSADELTKNYQSAGYQLFDWEHQRDQIIGFSLDAELISRPDKPLAVAFTGILNRLSHHMQAEERDGDMVIKRDELIRKRFFEGKLAVSMECLFDSMECMECGYETDNPLDFEFHTMIAHRTILESGERVSRGLIGVDYVGWGIIAQPADSDAYVSSLRTSDDGVICEDISVPADAINKYGLLAENIAFSKMVSGIDPSDTLINSRGNYSFASDKATPVTTRLFIRQEDDFDNDSLETIEINAEISAIVGFPRDSDEIDISSFIFKGDHWTAEKMEEWKKSEGDKHDLEKLLKKKKKKKKKKRVKKPARTTYSSTKNNRKTDKGLKTSNLSSKGGLSMFKLNEKISSSMSINDAIIVALRALKDFQGDRPLEQEEVDAFTTEFSEVMKAKIGEEDFRIGDVYTLTDSEKLIAIEAARTEEKTIADTTNTELQNKVEALDEEKTKLSKEVSDKTTEIDTLKNADAKRQNEAKVDKFISGIKEAGVILTDTFEADVRSLAEAKIGTETEEESLKNLKGDLIASVKRSTLTAASLIMGTNAIGGDDNLDSMSAKLEKVRDEAKK